MRRAALSSESGPSVEDQTGGGYPFDSMIRQLSDETDPTNVSFPFLRRMRRDHMISMGLHFISMPIVKAPWYFECDNARVAAFADNIIRPIYGRLVLTILRYLWAGYSPAVKRFDVVKPGWTYYEDGQAKQVWDSENVDALVYKPVKPLKPELCRPHFVNGNFAGIKYDKRYGVGAFLLDGQKKKDIDLLHSIWAVHGQEDEDGSLYGFSRIAHAAPIFHLYWYLWTLLGRGFENNADPGPVVRYPKDDPMTLDAANKAVKNVTTALTLGRRRRSGSTVALPSEHYSDFQDRPSSSAKKWDIEYPKHDTDFEALMNMIEFLEALKLRALWVPEQGLIEGTGGSSSRNVADNFGNQRNESQSVLMAQVMELIDIVMVQPALAINLPWFEGTIRMRSLGFGEQDEDMIRQMFQLVGQDDWRATGIDARKLAEAQGFPMFSPARQAELDAQIAAQAEQSQTPAVTPTQGRRAYVTQTGFGETAYVQLGGHIELSEDGDFVAELPVTKHFADRALVAMARELRGHTRAYHTQLYSEMARYVSTADPDTELEEVVAGWTPQADRAVNFASQVHRCAAKAFDRAAALESRPVDGDALSSEDRAQSKWLSDRAFDYVASINASMRGELRNFLAEELSPQQRGRKLSARAREEFSERPDRRSDELAAREVVKIYNYATLSTAQKAGIEKAQVLDDYCRQANGVIVSVSDALTDNSHSECAIGYRLLKPSDIEVVRTPTMDGLMARYDEETETVLLSPAISEEDEEKYMLVLGEHLQV